uniref:Putative secreted protein n=1 Tax=Anopheles darlingi TaxID=43151 RepID=A0A2M4DIB1_ANODA
MSVYCAMVGTIVYLFCCLAPCVRASPIAITVAGCFLPRVLLVLLSRHHALHRAEVIYKTEHPTANRSKSSTNQPANRIVTHLSRRSDRALLLERRAKFCIFSR